MAERWMGPTERSKYPQPTPWLFRGNNDLIALAVIVAMIIWWIWG